MEQACRQIETPGQEQSKYGLMYIHFNSLCLETFGKENQRKIMDQGSASITSRQQNTGETYHSIKGISN